MLRTQKVVRQTGSFTAIDANGQQYTIFIFTKFNQWRDSDGQHEVAGLKHMKTDDGRHVNFVGPSHYEIVDVLGNIPIKSTDPNAPQS